MTPACGSAAMGQGIATGVLRTRRTCSSRSYCTVMTPACGSAAMGQGGSITYYVRLSTRSITSIVPAFRSSTSAVTALGSLAGTPAVLCRGGTSHAWLDNDEDVNVPAAVVSCASMVIITNLRDVQPDVFLHYIDRGWYTIIDFASYRLITVLFQLFWKYSPTST